MLPRLDGIGVLMGSLIMAGYVLGLLILGTGILLWYKKDRTPTDHKKRYIYASKTLVVLGIMTILVTFAFHYSIFINK